jgi:hypothetical protein
MKPEIVPALPDRTELRVLYDDAINEIIASWDSKLLTTEFYTQTKDAIFDAGCLALADTATDTRRVHTVAAPPGGGKTTFSHAFVIAFTRYAEKHPDALYGAVFVVDTVKKANIVYSDLNKHLPGKVAIWTTDHDASSNKEPQFLDEEPAAKYRRKDLPNYPVIVVTHKAYLGPQGHYARDVVRNDANGVRALTVVDEKPEEVPVVQIELSEALKAVKDLMDKYPEADEQKKIKDKLDPLLRLMEEHNHKEPNKLFRPRIELDADALTKELTWFNTKEAKHLAKSSDIDGIDRLFDIGSTLTTGHAWAATEGVTPYFFGYQDNRIIKHTAGVILLDATADIDGVTSVVPEGRTKSQTPTARYYNLEIIHVAPPTKTKLVKYLEDADNAHAYVDWMVSVIKEHMVPGEKALVVCKKTLIKQQRVPNWPERDPRFAEKKVFTQDYGWDLEGRKLCVINWGAGIGRNDWQDADVVFLFDAFYPRRGISIARTQGYRGEQAHQGDLGSMRSLHSRAYGVDLIHDGQTNAWNKQMALRGRARQYDENGVCGKQRLIVGCDLKQFMLKVKKLFPGAKVNTEEVGSDNNTLAARILGLLSTTEARCVTAKELSIVIGRPWREVSRDVLTPFFRECIAVLGWKYIPVPGKPKKGRPGTRFERLEAPPAPLPQHMPMASLLTEQDQPLVSGATQVICAPALNTDQRALSVYP